MIDQYFATMERFRSNVANIPECRRGQNLFNAIAEEWPWAAEQIRGTDTDPFYNDKRIPECVRLLAAYAWLPQQG